MYPFAIDLWNRLWHAHFPAYQLHPKALGCEQKSSLLHWRGLTGIEQKFNVSKQLKQPRDSGD